MALNAGEDKDMRIQSSSVGFDNSSENPSSEQERTKIPDPNPGGSKSKVTSPTISYHECQKNHAANIGGNVTDGCGEFMPRGEEGTLEALMCAACSCHRNFHRQVHHSGEGGAGMVHPLHLTPPLPSPLISHHRGGSSHWSPMVQPVKMAFGGGGSVGTDSSSEELNFNSLQVAPTHFLSKKRLRTKFTAEQKEKMMEFAEKLGWRIPREDDSEMQMFCAEVGVSRQVFKVWMHNNKINSSKKNSQET